MTSVVIKNFQCQQFGDIQGEYLLWKKLSLLVFVAYQGMKKKNLAVVCMFIAQG
jgi:hypothetical protein